jgi:hypothetical protein
MDDLPSLNNIYSLVVQEESNDSVLISHVSLDEPSVLVKYASDLRKPYGRDKGSSTNKSSTRFFTFFNKYIHTIEYCHKKHGHPNIAKTNS